VLIEDEEKRVDQQTEHERALITEDRKRRCGWKAVRRRPVSQNAINLSARVQELQVGRCTNQRTDDAFSSNHQLLHVAAQKTSPRLHIAGVFAQLQVL